MLGQLDQFVGTNAIFLIGMVRVGADRAIDVGKPLRNRKQFAEAPHPRRDRNDPPDAGGSRASYDRVEIAGEIGKVKMAMTVD